MEYWDEYRYSVQMDLSSTCHRLFPNRIDLVTFDFFSPFVESKRFLSPFKVHSNVIVEDSVYAEEISITSFRERFGAYTCSGSWIDSAASVS